MLRPEDHNPPKGEAVMADDDIYNAQAHEQPPPPNPVLKSLDVMVGTWDLKGRESGPDGEIHGQVTFEWMEGGFFLVQRVDIDYAGRKITGTESIGYDETRSLTRTPRWAPRTTRTPTSQAPTTSARPRTSTALRLP